MAANPPPAPDVAPAEKLPFPMQEGEKVLLICRKHWWYLWPSLTFKALVGLVPILVLWFIFDAIGAYDGVGAQIFWVVTLLWAAYWGFLAFLIWYRYRHDIWVITDQRLVDVFKKNPFNLRVASADLINVQDTSVERVGILQTSLNFGDIVCETSGSSAGFRLAGIPNPTETQALIDRERDRERLRVRGI